MNGFSIGYLYYKRVDPGPSCLPFYKAPSLGVANDTHGRVLASTVFVSYSLHMARRYTQKKQCSLPNRQTVYMELDGRRQAGREGARKDGREGARGGSEEAMMCGRGSGSGGRERVRKEREHGRSEGKKGGRKRAEEGGNNRARRGAREEGR